MKCLGKILLVASFLVGGFFIFAPKTSAATEAAGLLTSSTTWTKAQSPIVVDPSFRLAPDVVLTIHPGVIVKSKPAAELGPDLGFIRAIGTSLEPIIFTALTDDTLGGDTNGDGSATIPFPGFWGGIHVHPLHSQVQFAHIRYGATCLIPNSSDIIITDNQIEHCGTGIDAQGRFHFGGIIQNNLLNKNNIGIRITAGQGFQITGNTISGSFSAISLVGGTQGTVNRNELSQNFRGIFAEAHTNGAIHQNNLQENVEFGILNSPFVIPAPPEVLATNNWWGDASGPFHPVLNPAGLGSRVGEKVSFEPWLGSKVVIGAAPKPDPVIIIPGILGSESKNGVLLIDPILHTYDDLIATLKANGYVEGKDLFTFPYNWRQSNVLTALELRNRINEVQGVCSCAKVDLVAHSMGGLVARQYIQSALYEADVDQLIFLGTPHLGAPKAYLAWEGAEPGPKREDSLLKFILTREAKKSGFSSLFEYIRNKPIPSINELLPIYDYLREKDTATLRVYPTNYPQNVFLEILNNNLNLLLSSGVRITNIVGNVGLNSTISALRVVLSPTVPLWEHGYPEGFKEKIGDRGLEMGLGDGTVSELSGSLIATDLNFLAAEHKELATLAEGLVFKKLTGRDATILIDKSRIPAVKLLIFKLLSPVDFQVIAPDGKKVGKDFTTGQELNEIADAFYSGFLTDDEFITIPNPLDGEYRIITQGTDNGGEYTVSVGYITDELLVEQDFIAQTLPGMVTELKLSLDNIAPQNLAVKPQDQSPPQISIISPLAKDYLHSELLPINVNITDSTTGVFSSAIRFDDIMVNSGEVVDLFFHSLGNHSLSVKAADFVSNTATSTVNFRIIATVESTITDIERAFALGWITDDDAIDDLLNILHQIQKDQPRLDKQDDIEKLLREDFTKKLEAFRNKGMINEQAYRLIKEDRDWLLNN